MTKKSDPTDIGPSVVSLLNGDMTIYAHTGEELVNVLQEIMDDVSDRLRSKDDALSFGRALESITEVIRFSRVGLISESLQEVETISLREVMSFKISTVGDLLTCKVSKRRKKRR
jgi:hypothetical protein